MKTKACRVIFEEVQGKRHFAQSVYKFKEDAALMDLWEKEVCQIEAWKRGGACPMTLMRCTSGDAHIWLRKLPTGIAERLGHMLPALDGLIGDDVSAVTISAIKNKYMPLVEQLVDDCDFVAQQLKTDIGNSDLKSLLRQASVIFDGVLADAGYARM